MRVPVAATAHDLTLAECIEGSDFIKHAAMSRENGMTRENFLGRMESDIKVIRQFPPQLRWFVQDRDDEELLDEGSPTGVRRAARAGASSIGFPGSLHGASG